jgi:hypothetical protein
MLMGVAALWTGLGNGDSAPGAAVAERIAAGCR